MAPERREAPRFVLLFPELESVHLHKDVGQIPFQMQRHLGYRAEIVCRKNEERYLYLDGELAGLTLTFAEKGELHYLRQNARDIDVLMLFHVKTESIYAALLYKALNPRGVVFVKYDLPDRELLYATWGHRNFITQLKRSLLFSFFLRCLDLFSVECRQVYEGVEKIPAEKKLHLPNGFDPEIPAWYGVLPRPLEEKENLILLVGRHGTRQKNSELLLAALREMGDIGDWQVHFVGPMTDGFRRDAAAVLEKHPQYRGKVHFHGNISDKRTLFEFYSRAKIFCLPSRWESWGLACVEALSFGCVLMMSQEVSSSFDLTEDGKSGLAISGEDAAAWARNLRRLMGDRELLADYSRRGKALFDKRFVWKEILKELSGRIDELRSRR